MSWLLGENDNKCKTNGNSLDTHREHHTHIHNYNKARLRLQCTSEPHRDELAEEKHSIAYSNMTGNEKRCKGQKLIGKIGQSFVQSDNLFTYWSSEEIARGVFGSCRNYYH